MCAGSAEVDRGEAPPQWLVNRNAEARTHWLVKQLEQLGHTVHIDPAA